MPIARRNASRRISKGGKLLGGSDHYMNHDGKWTSYSSSGGRKASRKTHRVKSSRGGSS